MSQTKQLVQLAFKQSLFHTTQTLCGFKDITVNTHGPIIRSLESETKRKLICVPRGTFKSSIACIAYPIWLLLKNPNLRIMIDSEIAQNSYVFYRQIKLIMQSELFRGIFGDVRSNKWNETELIVAGRTNKTLKEPSLTYSGVGSMKVGMHYDVIIGDDYHSPRNSQTPEQRRKIIDHYKYNQSILDPDGIYVIIGTRYSEDDLIGWVMKNELGLQDSSSRANLLKLEHSKGVFYD